MAVADVGTLTQIQTQFLTVCSGGKVVVFKYAWSLLYLFSGISLALAAVYWLLDRSEILAELIKKIMLIGLFVLLVKGFGPGYDGMNFTNILVQSFYRLGSEAGGGLSVNVVADPSALLDVGLQATNPIFQNVMNSSLMDLPRMCIQGIAGLLILFSFLALAIQIFLTNIEFAIVGTLGLIFLPCGVFKPLAHFAEKFFAAIFSFGVKLMVLSFLCAVAFPILKGFTLPADPTLNQMFSLLFASMAIAFLSWHAPSVAASMLSGRPSLTTGHAGQAAVVSGMAVTTVASPAAPAVGAAVKGTAAMAGAVSSGGMSALKSPLQATQGATATKSGLEAFSVGRANMSGGATSGGSTESSKTESPLKNWQPPQQGEKK